MPDAEHDTARPVRITESEACDAGIHDRWATAPGDPVKVVAYAICGDDQAMEDRYISAGYHAEAAAALRALGMPG